MKLTFPHIVAYIAGPLAAFAGLSPAIVATLVGPKLAPFAAPAIVLAGALLTFFHDVGLIPSKTAPAVTTVAKVFLPLLIVLPFMGGCATNPQAQANIDKVLVAPQTGAALVALSDAAVGVAVSKGIPAADIASIASQLQQFAQGQAVTLPALNAELTKLEAKASFNAAEIAAAAVLVQSFDALIQAQLKGGTLDPNAQAFISEVLTDVIAAAELFGAPAPAPAAAPAPTTTTDLGAQPRGRYSASLGISPSVFGGATSTVVVAVLKAFAHVQVASPVAAAITVLATVVAMHWNL